MNRNFLAVLLLCPGLLTGCSQYRTPEPEPVIADLVVYTYQEEMVCSPIIKEYQERTGLTVQVINGTYEELREQVLAGTLPEICDVVFGADAALLESAPECWEPYAGPEASAIANGFSSAGKLWTGFSARPLVIMYNTRVVTYRELPEGWNSLLEPRWHGRIAFMKPTLSDVYACALTAAIHAPAAPDHYVEQLAANTDYTAFDSLSDLNQAIAEGRRFVGVTTEENAVSLISEGADIDYIYPQEGMCVLIDATAIVAGSSNSDQAKAFIDFTVGIDVQYFLTSAISRRSVRTDILPPPGLSPLNTLSYTSVSLQDEYEKTIKIWNEVFPSTSEERK